MIRRHRFTLENGEAHKAQIEKWAAGVEHNLILNSHQHQDPYGDRKSVV